VRGEVEEAGVWGVVGVRAVPISGGGPVPTFRPTSSRGRQHEHKDASGLVSRFGFGYACTVNFAPVQPDLGETSARPG
jgi:hypothetical protein